jgi:hypothetical protein
MAELLPTPPAGSIGFHKKLVAVTAAALAVALVPVAVPAPTSASSPPAERVSVIVREVEGPAAAPEALVENLGGRVGRWSGKSWSGNAWSSATWGP